MLKTGIGVSTWNSADTIEECVQSLIDVKYPNKEIIIVDDGSKDDTLSRLSKYPVQVIQQNHKGVVLSN